MHRLALLVRTLPYSPSLLSPFPFPSFLLSFFLPSSLLHGTDSLFAQDDRDASHRSRSARELPVRGPRGRAGDHPPPHGAHGADRQEQHEGGAPDAVACDCSVDFGGLGWLVLVVGDGDELMDMLVLRTPSIDLVWIWIWLVWLATTLFMNCRQLLLVADLEPSQLPFTVCPGDHRADNLIASTTQNFVSFVYVEMHIHEPLP